MTQPLGLTLARLVLSEPFMVDALAGRAREGFSRTAEESSRALWAHLRRSADRDLHGFPPHQIEGAVQTLVAGGEFPHDGTISCEVDGSMGVPVPLGNYPFLTALDRLERYFFVHRQGAPALRFSTLLEFQSTTDTLWTDQMYCFSLAKECLADPEGRVRDEELRKLLAGGLLPWVEDPIIAGLRQSGLAETHRHFNGSALPALLWSDLLHTRGQWCHGKDSLASGLDPQTTTSWSLLALELRNCITEVLYFSVKEQRTRQPAESREYREKLQRHLRRWISQAGNPAIQEEAQWPLTLPGSPWLREPAGLLPGSDQTPQGVERAFLFHAFRYLLTPTPPHEGHTDFRASLSEALHLYLVLQNLLMRELIQPHHGVTGFERFDRYSGSSARRVTETRDTIRRRIEQARDTGGVKWLELRIAPKKTVAELVEQIRPIVTPLDPNSSSIPCLGVVYHFIRQRDPHSAPAGKGMPVSVRHASLRREIFHQAFALDRLRREYPDLGKHIVGLDAANAETNTPPEVFAPVIRWLRRRPSRIEDILIPHTHRENTQPGYPLGLTYHAGEDFRHLISGLRAVHEAINFLEMGPGDRIGHGVALGLDPLEWIKRYGGTFYLSRMEWLDNLVWFRGMLAEFGVDSGFGRIIEKEIFSLAAQIYRDAEGKVRHHHWELLEQARRRRYWNPLDDITLNPDESRDMKHESAEVLQLWNDYHLSPEVRRAGNHVFPLRWPRDTWGRWAEAMRLVQDGLLRGLTKCRIAIEVNPSSNLTICPFLKMSDHPVFRWHPPGDSKDPIRPFIIIGSDDPGIFGTELIYEYAYLSRAAQELGWNPREIRDWLHELRKTSIDFCFVRTGYGGHHDHDSRESPEQPK